MTAALGRAFQWAIYSITILLWVTGVVWIYQEYVVPVPPAPLWLKLHGAAAMLFLILFGALYTKHMVNGWRQKRQRPSAIFLVSSFVLLIFTGWGLYYLGNESARLWTSRVHIVIGLILPAILGFHAWFAHRRLRRAASTRF